MKSTTIRTPRPASHITREFPNPPDLHNRRYYEVSDVAWLVGLPERVVRENISLSRTRS